MRKKFGPETKEAGLNPEKWTTYKTVQYRQGSFYTRDTFLKNVAQIKILQIKHKISIYNTEFCGG